MTTREQVQDAINKIKIARDNLADARTAMVIVGSPTFDVLKLQKRMVKLENQLTALKKHFASKI